ncbi:hypothetical protein [Sweet potato vein clearing virus]|uniref:Uncharacterized protein n=1 Tax=Sweet potato vein clearing virus TaxID=995049 RepID=F2XXY7_9VIRU|nr:hypothetical protein SPVCVp1 [Sweet potato vein clearing virus]ADZ45058.1 hypothetical protein [Sweet potato vein clearing virus]
MAIILKIDPKKMELVVSTLVNCYLMLFKRIFVSFMPLNTDLRAEIRYYKDSMINSRNRIEMFELLRDSYQQVGFQNPFLVTYYQNKIDAEYSYIRELTILMHILCV